MTKKVPLVSPEEVGARIAWTRAALGMNQSELARRLGYSKPNKISQWESGVHLPSLGAAMVMCNELGLTLDWIFRNDKSSLPGKIIERLDEYARHREAGPPDGRPSSLRAMGA